MELITDRIVKNLSVKNLLVINKKTKINYRKLTGVILLDNLLSIEKSPTEFIEKFAKNMLKGQILVLIDRVLDIDDAYINTIDFIRDNNHIRYYTLPELIGFTEGHFRLTSYDIITKEEKIKNAKAKIIEAYNELPFEIKGLIDYKLNGGDITTKIRCGVFTFTKI